MAWSEFRKGKGLKQDVMEFEKNLEQNIFELSRNLKNKKYRHSSYTGFYITDPKLRHVHKASVRDRVLHHSVFQTLNPIFEPTFISTSFSCRVNKGTHKGVEAVKRMLNKASGNNTQTCYALKCDIQKFFDSIDQAVLIKILSNKINDTETMELFRELIGSYKSEARYERERERERERVKALRALPIREYPLAT